MPAGSADAHRGLDPADVYASFGRRFAASFLDGVIFIAAITLLNVVTGADDETGGFSLVALVLGWLYKSLMESSVKQATLGKMALGIKVCSVDGRRIGFGRATGRYFGTWLSAVILYIGFVMAAFTTKRQALHDLLAGTLVVRAAADEEDVRTAVTPRNAAGGLVAVALVLVGICVAGILAAIAIPAYQDYTIRAQVSEGFAASAAAKVSIADALAERRDPATLTSASLELATPARLRYVERIDIERGAIIVTFGPTAHALLAGKRLGQVPTVSANGEVRWICGRVLPQPGFTPVTRDYRNYTNVDLKYLPTACRG